MWESYRHKGSFWTQQRWGIIVRFLGECKDNDSMGTICGDPLHLGCYIFDLLKVNELFGPKSLAQVLFCLTSINCNDSETLAFN
jgi:hypothetical protein